MKEPSIHFRKGIEAGIHGLLEESAQCFDQGHEQGDLECSAELAICYRVGAGVPRDFNEFYRLARELEQKDCPLAHCLLASAYADGLGCRGDYEKAESHLTQWAKISEAPMPGISEECRLRMRALGLSEGVERYMELAQAEDGTVPCIDIMQAIREYAQKTSMADKIMAEMTVLAQEEGKKEELIRLMEQACREGIADAECLLGHYMLQSCEEGDLDTWNKGVELMRRTNETSAIEFLLQRLNIEEDEKEREKLSNQIVDSMRFGPLGIHRKDELPVRINVTRNRWSVAYLVYSEEATAEMIDRNQAGRLLLPQTLPFVYITNTDSTPLEKLSMRFVQEGMGGEQTCELEEDLMPGERTSIDLNQYAADQGNSIRLELSVADGRYTTIVFPPCLIAHVATRMPMVVLYHTPDSLIILPREQDMEKLELQTPSGEKIAELNNLRQDEPVTVDIWHIKSLMVKERANAFILVCPDADPALCFLK